MSRVNSLLFKNGVVSPDTPPVASFLEAHPGAYTTTRTHNNGSQLLFWKRHTQRLSNSVQILYKCNPQLLFRNPKNCSVPFSELLHSGDVWDSVIQELVYDSMRKVVPFVQKEREFVEELSITILVSGNLENVDVSGSVFDSSSRISEVLDVYMHIGGYVPPVFGVSGNGATLAVVGRGRDSANAKYSDWVRLRKQLEKLRPPSVTELLLSNDGDHILEGCLTNFFVVCLKDKDKHYKSGQQNGVDNPKSVEVQTAPLGNGVLPGVIRQVIRDVCLELGIPFREVAPSWSHRKSWTEAFITNSLRLIQHVQAIKAPNSWNSVDSESWEQIMWVEKRFEDPPGRVTSIIQRKILERASIETFPIASFEEGQSVV